MELTDKVVAVCKALDDKKALDISVIDITKNSSVADVFVLATSTSITHARTLSDSVCDASKRVDEKVLSIDGHGQANWIGLDLGDIIVHIFTKEMRDLYSLEKMWADSRNHKKFIDIKKDIQKKEDKNKATKKAIDSKAQKTAKVIEDKAKKVVKVKKADKPAKTPSPKDKTKNSEKAVKKIGKPQNEFKKAEKTAKAVKKNHKK